MANSYGPDSWDNLDSVRIERELVMIFTKELSQDVVCNTGLHQSPVNIVTSDLVTEASDPGAIITSGLEEDISGHLANTGRMLQFAFLGFARPTITGGPLNGKK